jgi:hypothetical protein
VLEELAGRCTPSSFFLGLGFLVLTCLVLLSFLSLVLVLELLVLDTLVRSLGTYVGVAFVALTGRRLLRALSGLSFCGRAETSFDVLVF